MCLEANKVKYSNRAALVGGTPFTPSPSASSSSSSSSSSALSSRTFSNNNDGSYEITYSLMKKSLGFGFGEEIVPTKFWDSYGKLEKVGRMSPRNFLELPTHIFEVQLIARLANETVDTSSNFCR